MGEGNVFGFLICGGSCIIIISVIFLCIYLYIAETKRLKIKEKIAKYWAISNYIKMYLEVKKLNDFTNKDIVERARQAMRALEKELGF